MNMNIDFLTLIGVFNYGLVLIFGLFLSVYISGGCKDRRQKYLVLALCPVFLLIQTPCWLILGVSVTKKLYPLIVHAPLTLVLVFAFKRRVSVAFVSVFTAYLCCQLPRWINLALTAFSGSALIGEISYTLSIFPIYFLLSRYFTSVAYSTLTYSTQSLVLFGSLPFAYYIFDYTTVIYSDALYKGIPILTEFLPTALILFYVVFLTIYHAQLQNKIESDLQTSILEMELRQSAAELETLRHIDIQTAIHRHDMRHHLNVISGFLSSNQPLRAEAYIKSAQDDIAAIIPEHFCENELINLILSSFSKKAEKENIRFTSYARISNALTLSDTELTAILSNALENAFHAVINLASDSKWVDFYLNVKANKVLIEIKNPYFGELLIQNELPVSSKDGHGYGCRSIKSIVEKHKGMCSFSPENGIFVLRVILPLSTKNA